MANPANLTSRVLDVLQLLKEGLQNKEIAEKLFLSPKTIDHHISAIFFKPNVDSSTKAVEEATRMEIIKWAILPATITKKYIFISQIRYNEKFHFNTFIDHFHQQL
jgi:DNA-binding CsgD family transcriptional regulator